MWYWLRHWLPESPGGGGEWGAVGGRVGGCGGGGGGAGVRPGKGAGGGLPVAVLSHQPAAQTAHPWAWLRRPLLMSEAVLMA